MRGNSFSYLLKQGFKNIYVNRLMSLASIGVLTACFLLIGGAVLFSLNINSLMGYVESQNRIVAFVENNLPEEQMQQIDETIRGMDNLGEIEFFSEEQAMEEQREDLGDAAVLLDGLDEDTFPPSYRMTVQDLTQLDQTVAELESIEGVYRVNAYNDVAETLTSIKNMVSVAGIAVVLILAVVSIMIIANTIKVTVFNRRKEINIMKYVGATDGFIRVPFLVEGTILGVISALISFGLLWWGYGFVVDWISSNSSPWISMAQTCLVPFVQVAPWLVGGFLLGGILIGVLGSVIFVRRYLKV